MEASSISAARAWESAGGAPGLECLFRETSGEESVLRATPKLPVGEPGVDPDASQSWRTESCDVKALTTYSPTSQFGKSNSTAELVGQVMLLVAVAIGFGAFGAFVGRGLSSGAAITASFAGLGMLIVQAFGGERFRVGPLAVAWLFAVGWVVGLGLGPALVFYTSAQPTAVLSAGVTTALVVAAMGFGGYAFDRDLSRWLRPLTFVIFGLVVVSLVLFLAGSGGSPWLSLAIAVVSALLILVDFNYLRRHGTDDYAVLLATGIFVSIVNVFLSLLNIFSER
jgi:FtsH-binding integral membrane protein